MSNVKVSVIVPIYNVAPFLEKCLSSLCRQSLREIEILCVNDGSPDSSDMIIEEFRSLFPDLIKVLNKENGGLSDARNFGMSHATGKYIAFLDGDDYMDPDLLEELYERAEETDADAVACPIRYVWPDGVEKVVFSGIPLLAEGEKLKKTFTRFYPAVWNKLYRRDVLLHSGVSFKKGFWFEDVEFSHRLFPYLKKVAAVELPCINYVQREGSVTAKADDRLFHYLSNFETIVSFFRERELFPEWEKEVEFAAARYLLATFLKRATAFEEETFDRAVKESLSFLKKHFPHWKKNPYLLKSGGKGLYLLLFTPTLAKLLRKLKSK